ncbi:monoheme cytochrome C SoxX [Oceanicola sp. 22II-s10i]|uniref:sulfur oxidation c-type cytochrome SoxX n=1 Tax=Oceanicola sp. 22II-s10i TaxID=1317116 RepID=UPI000B52756A|nr:sulfur oxidation c-type cytochrome SoxX [Oceanicola sp. 22II-s10i]OWU83445.1 monoheme cytochrome C SoxX [Oceanicola sp. 22II-s10i]
MRLTATALAATLVAGVAIAAPVAPDDVAYDGGAIEASLTGTAGDPENGKAIMTNRAKGNCVACHEVTALSAAPFHGTVGPTLDSVGDTWSEAELRGIVANAKMTFDGTVMPPFYKVSGFTRPGDGYTGKAAPADLAPILTAQEIEDVVAFLKTLKE